MEQNARIEEQNAQIEKQGIQIENMIQTLLLARKKLFGASTEAAKQVEGQLFLFEEAQKLAEQPGAEQKKVTVRPYTRTAGKPGVRAEMLAGLPVEVEEYVMPEGEVWVNKLSLNPQPKIVILSTSIGKEVGK